MPVETDINIQPFLVSCDMRRALLCFRSYVVLCEIKQYESVIAPIRTSKAATLHLKRDDADSCLRCSHWKGSAGKVADPARLQWRLNTVASSPFNTYLHAVQFKHASNRAQYYEDRAESTDAILEHWDHFSKMRGMGGVHAVF